MNAIAKAYNTTMIYKRYFFNDKRVWLMLSFLAVYTIWGSTYLGIKYAITTMPPFAMAGMRFLCAGMVMLGLVFVTKQYRLTLKQLLNSMLLGFSMLVLGNGVLIWAQMFIESSIAALLVAIEPLWVVLVLWIYRGKMPNAIVWLGIIVGIIGMFVLIGIGHVYDVNHIYIPAVLAVVFSTLVWALASVYGSKADLPSSSYLSIAIQMLTASLVMSCFAWYRGDWAVLDWSKVSNESFVAFAYLIVFGSLIGYSAYTYIVKNAKPSSVSTYAYVNPLVAVLLGKYLGGEELTSQTILAAFLLISAVVIIVRFGKSEH